MKKDIAYVATEMLPEQPAPINTHGPIAWMQANLFSTPRDSILTVIFAAVVLLTLYKLLPWLLIDSVFFAEFDQFFKKVPAGFCSGRHIGIINPHDLNFA